MLGSLLSILEDSVYCYHHGPMMEGDCWCDQKLSVNCQLFAHIVLEELGYALPKWLRSAELYRRSSGGKVWVEKVSSPDAMQLGDILLLSHRKPRHIQDNIIFYLHVAICIDPKKNAVAHATRYDKEGNKDPRGGSVKVEKLDDILKSKRYNTLVGIRRVNR